MYTHLVFKEVQKKSSPQKEGKPFVHLEIHELCFPSYLLIKF